MNARKRSLFRATGLMALVALLAAGCGRTSRETVLSSDTLKVVAVTESTLDINVSQYRHYTTYVLYVEGSKLSDTAFAALLRDPDAAGQTFVHTDVVVLGDDAVLLASRNRDGTRCWATRLSTRSGTAAVETIVAGTVDCSLGAAPRGWTTLHDDASNLLLIRAQPFQVHRMAGYWYVLWIEGDVAALYTEDRDQQRLVVRLAAIDSDATLAEQVLPKATYAVPDLLHASPEARKQWLFENFTVSMAGSPAIQLRSDNRLDTITPEVWAEYQAIDRQNKQDDARARAAGEAWIEAQRRALHDAEKQAPRAAD